MIYKKNNCIFALCYGSVSHFSYFKTKEILKIYWKKSE